MTNRNKIEKIVRGAGLKIKYLEFDRKSLDEGGNWVLDIETHDGEQVVSYDVWTEFIDELEAELARDLQDGYYE